jgi:hypothetical protein
MTHRFIGYRIHDNGDNDDNDDNDDDDDASEMFRLGNW